MGLERSLKRQQMREQYRKFQRSWNDEKIFQRYLVEKHGASVKQKDGHDVIVTQNGEEHAVLGRRPTFNMWLKMVDDHRAKQAAPRDTQKVDVEDLSWDEGG